MCICWITVMYSINFSKTPPPSPPHINETQRSVARIYKHTSIHHRLELNTSKHRWMYVREYNMFAARAFLGQASRESSFTSFGTIGWPRSYATYLLLNRHTYQWWQCVCVCECEFPGIIYREGLTNAGVTCCGVSRLTFLVE